MTDAVICLSGGLDSTVLAYDILNTRPGLARQDLSAVCFNYGQRHYTEIDHARRIAETLRIDFEVLEIAGLFGCNDNLLTGKGSSPVVPNRNAIFLSIAVSYAITRGARAVYYAPTVEDYELFSDCRPEFVDALNELLQSSEIDCLVFAPFIRKTKKEIVELGRRLMVPFDQTWSCYEGTFEPCGACLACLNREEALRV